MSLNFGSCLDPDEMQSISSSFKFLSLVWQKALHKGSKDVLEKTTMIVKSLIHNVRVLITLFMVAAVQRKKVAYYFKLKKHLRPVMVILHAMCSVLKMQWLIWQSVILAGFSPLKSNFIALRGHKISVYHSLIPFFQTA